MCCSGGADGATKCSFIYSGSFSSLTRSPPKRDLISIVFHVSLSSKPKSGYVAETMAIFSFLYLKKIKISKIYVYFEKFRKYTPVARGGRGGDRGPVAQATDDRTLM